MRKSKNNLDERQEQMLLRIEHNGCWLAFWGLVAAIIVQSIILDFNLRNMAGELLVFIPLALYIAVGCIKRGIWDRYLKPNTSSNVVVSLTAALITGILRFLYAAKSFPDMILDGFAAGMIQAAVTFVVCFVILQLAAGLFRKKQAELEEELPENDYRL